MDIQTKYKFNVIILFEFEFQMLKINIFVIETGRIIGKILFIECAFHV